MWQVVAGDFNPAASICRIVAASLSFYTASSMGNIRNVTFLFVMMVFTPLASAVDATNPRLEKLYAGFIAPCCWSRNLTEHNSQIAAEMRGRIDQMVQAGRSDDEIKSVFVAKYGKRSSGPARGHSRSVAVLDARGCGGSGIDRYLFLPQECGATICRRTGRARIRSNNSQCDRR